jgi:hypothetical protein
MLSSIINADIDPVQEVESIVSCFFLVIEPKKAQTEPVPSLLRNFNNIHFEIAKNKEEICPYPVCPP